jgi:hypothetical protein
MVKIKNIILILILIIGVTALGCVGKKSDEKVPLSTPTQPSPSQSIVTPGQTVSSGTNISDADLNSIETDINNIDSTFNESNDADSLELDVNI